MSLKATQYLLVLGAFAFGLLPAWGAFAYAAAWVALMVGTLLRTRRARRVLEANFEKLGPLPPEAQAWARRFAFAYVWPQSAKDWGTTWQMTGLLALLISPFVAGHAVLFQDWSLFWLLVPLAASLFFGGWMALRLEVASRMIDAATEDEKALHDAVATKVALKSAVGLWPPEPSPDAAP